MEPHYHTASVWEPTAPEHPCMSSPGAVCYLGSYLSQEQGSHESPGFNFIWPPPLSQSACNPSSSQNLPACQTSCHGRRGLLLIQAEGRRVSRIPVQLACWAPQAACRPEAMADADVIPVDWTTAYPQLAETFSKLLLWSLQLTFQFGNFVYAHSLFFPPTLPFQQEIS